VTHELTHGFDDVGRRYDQKGRLHNWWQPNSVLPCSPCRHVYVLTKLNRYDQNGRLHNWWQPKDVVAFKKRAECLKDYYSQLQVDGKNVDGSLTLAENIADNGGIKISFEAFLQLMQGKGTPATDADKQLFFLSWGQTWCSVQRKKTARLALEDDVHAPDKYRVNGPLTQYGEFADAWSCNAKAIMAPPNRCGQGYGPVW